MRTTRNTCRNVYTINLTLSAGEPYSSYPSSSSFEILVQNEESSLPVIKRYLSCFSSKIIPPHNIKKYHIMGNTLCQSLDHTIISGAKSKTATKQDSFRNKNASKNRTNILPIIIRTPIRISLDISCSKVKSRPCRIWCIERRC